MARRVLALLRSVRVRITVASAVAFAIVFSVASLTIVRSVRSSLVHRERAETNDALNAVSAQLQAGRAPAAVRLRFARPVFFQIVTSDGTVVAGTIDTPIVKTGSDGQPHVMAPALPGVSDQVVAYRTVDSPIGPVTVAVANPLADLHRSIDALSRALWFATPSLVILVGLLSWWLIGRALKPVEAIRAQVDEISTKTLHRRVPVPGTGDEIAALAGTMNAMLDRLENAQTRQHQFVSDASHELRSPIASMRTELEVGLHAPGVTDWPTVAGRVLSENERLGNLVDDLLELARTDEGAAPRAFHDVDLDELVLSEAARARRVPIRTAGVSAGRVAGDARQLAQVVRNLLDNAALHASSLASVSVRSDEVTDARAAGATRTDIVLTVEDDGPGVPDSDRARIFERFTRLDESRARGEGGAGLGLALVARLVAAHRGTVTCDDSPGLGGARFIVRLPAAGEPAPEGTAEVGEPGDGEVNPPLAPLA